MIKVNEKYVIQADSNCYSLSILKTSKSGKQYPQALSYHTTMSEAFESLVRREQRALVESNDMDLKEAVKEFKRIQDELCGTLKVISDKETTKCQK